MGMNVAPELGAMILKGTSPPGALNQIWEEKWIGMEARKHPGMKTILLFPGTRQKKKITVGDLEDEQPGDGDGKAWLQPRIIRSTFCGGLMVHVMSAMS